MYQPLILAIAVATTFRKSLSVSSLYEVCSINLRKTTGGGALEAYVALAEASLKIPVILAEVAVSM